MKSHPFFVYILMCKPRVMGCIGKVSNFMSSLVTERCPHCGNVVEGKVVKTYTNKVARQGAKSAVHMVTGMGGMGTGAAIGSMILPGVGTVVGGALGFVGSAMVNQKVNENIDKLGDKIENEFLSMDYEFECPNCHCKWTRGSNELSPEEIMAVIGFINKTRGENLGVNPDSLTPQTNLTELGSRALIEVALLDLYEKLNFDLPDIEKIVYVDDCYEAILGISLWEAEQGTAVKEQTPTLKPALSPEEKEYLEEFKEIIADGEITERERRLLNKIRAQFGISVERGEELESMIMQPSLTPEEQEYLSEYKEIIAEGEVSERERRFLEKLRKANGISEERAAEIEHLSNLIK